jgi:hypothetical protein
VSRLKLIVQNRRYLVLTPKGPSPNLASQAMGAALTASKRSAYLAGKFFIP